MNKRLFIALEIPEIIKMEILAKRDSIAGNVKFKWEPIEKYHITLKFLGDVDSEKIESLSEIIESCIKDFRITEIQFSKFGFFYRENIPTILWAGLKENYSLSNFVKSLELKLSEINFKQEKRKFKSHITILRIKEKINQNLIDDFKKGDLNELVFIPAQIIFYESKLQKSGSVYSAIKVFNL